jgi:hypothetical protein
MLSTRMSVVPLLYKEPPIDTTAIFVCLADRVADRVHCRIDMSLF